MSIILIVFALIIVGTLLAWKLTNNLHNKFYCMAEVRGCADIYESIVRLNKYTQPRELVLAYQEAISCTKAA